MFVLCSPNVLPGPSPRPTSNGFSNAAIYSDSVSDPAFANYTASSTFSFSAWFKTDLLDSSNNPIVSRMSYDFSRGYALMVNAGIVSFYLNANWNTETLYAQSDIDTYNDGEWHHVVVTYDGNASSSSITMYIDGELASTTVTESSFTTSSNIEASDIAADFMIGVIGTWDGAQHSNFNGYIDDVARWDIVLTEEDASLIYTYGISGNSVASISGSGGAYHIDDPITFTATVSTDLLPPPDGYDGYVLFSYTNPISISDNFGESAEITRYVNNHMVLSVVGSAGSYPFEIHAGSYLVEYPAYLCINLPEIGHKLYIGSNFNEKEQFGGIIDQFRIVSELSGDTRVTELFSASTRSVTDEYNRVNPACPDSQTLTLIPFNNPINLQAR
ncbi:MAG: LamG domain-containing protein, partial [Alphaproteobacteria bacterium]|nr:LamG domain-containing protein [Alphaproteobacteria bacterium]